MDRNRPSPQVKPVRGVALRKESVDRNKVAEAEFFCIGQSLSARRAWIEITSEVSDRVPLAEVALRKESVDRNLVGCIDRTIDIMSLSARRAWIEMPVSASTNYAA